MIYGENKKGNGGFYEKGPFFSGGCYRPVTCGRVPPVYERGRQHPKIRKLQSKPLLTLQ